MQNLERMTQTPHLIVLMTMLWFAVPPSNVLGQRIDSWNDKAESAYFIEGTYDLDVSSSVELVSFHDGFYDFSPGESETLFFSIESPSDDQFLLKVQERMISEFYGLESQPGVLETGRNLIGPWMVDRYLKDLGIRSSNLGVVCRIMADDSPYILPVSVISDSSGTASSKYRAVLRLPESIKSGVYRMYPGKIEGAFTTEAMYSARFGRKAGGETVQLTLPKRTMEDYLGWVTVYVSMKPAQSFEPLPFRFYFYHNSH